jgi:hypothetical protein
MLLLYEWQLANQLLCEWPIVYYVDGRAKQKTCQAIGADGRTMAPLAFGPCWSIAPIVESALKNRHQQFVIDGEAVLLGVEASRIDALAQPPVRRRGAVLRLRYPRARRRRSAQAATIDAQGQSGTVAGAPSRRHLHINPFERGEIGPDLFRAAYDMCLEGLVSKRRDRPYQAGRSRHWIKVKNRQHFGDVAGRLSPLPSNCPVLVTADVDQPCRKGSS